MKRHNVISKQFPCHFLLSFFNFFPFVVVAHRCSKLICIKLLYPIIYVKWKISVMSENRMGGMPGLCPNGWFAAKQWTAVKWISCLPLVQFSEWFGAPRAGSFWKKNEVMAPCHKPCGPRGPVASPCLSQYMPNSCSFHKASKQKS